MVFIREGNHIFGFVVAEGRRYTFDLTLPNSFPISQVLLKVDWRLKRDLGESLNGFLKSYNVFKDPEEFYHQFNIFVQNSFKTSRAIEIWLQHPLKTAVLVKSLQQEIGKVGEYIKHFDLKSGLLKIEATDSQFRIHKAVLKLSQNYKNEPISIISHDLPQQKLGIKCTPNLDHIFSVCEFCEKFLEFITCFQQFWNAMSLIDSQCCVLDPGSPTYKDVFRRIKLSNTLSVVLTFNPFFPNQRPKIKLLGCQSEVNHLQNILQRNLENDVWDSEDCLLFNISNVLEVSIPSKIFIEEPKALDVTEAGECAICFTWRLNDEIPNEICENSSCKSLYHSICLFTYFSSIPRNRDYFGKMQGECPNCDCNISCTVPKLMIMNEQEISAFAAFSAKHNARKSELKKKSKKKFKKKKSHDNGVHSAMNTLLKVKEPSTPENINGEIKKKHTEQKDLIKSILKAQKESIFKDCTLTTKVDNLFLKGNDLLNDEANHENILQDSVKPKKAKKKKLLNGEQINNSEINKSIHKNAQLNCFVNNGEKAAKPNSERIISKSLKSDTQNKIKQKLKKDSIIFCDSVKLGEEVFSWMLSPLSLNDFFESCWEQKPLHIQHNSKDYFKCICTFEDFKAALREHDMYFTKNIDVTSYINGERNTENLEGKAKPTVIWDFYQSGRSIRLLNPQSFIPNVRLLNTTLQEFFHCFVGANIYLTPPGTQGFAPHYDDIEAFVLQLEGEKHWKLYNPRSPDEVLPRLSSRNFKEDEIGEPILEVILQPGDLLYFPRGIIHQAKSLPHVHSLHITVSCYQKNTWADLLEKVLPVALQKAINEDVELRKGLPIGYLNCLGLIHSDQKSNHRQDMIKKFEELAQKVLDHCPLDAGVDQLGANYIHDALPPCLNEVEEIYGASRNCRREDEDFFTILKNSSDKDLNVKLIRATAVRLVSEGDEMVMYYTTDNSLVYREHEVFSVTITSQWAQALEYLIHSYPKFVQMKELPVSIKVNKPGKWKRIVEFVYFLWQKGLLLFDRPLRQV